MKLGLLSAILENKTFEEVIDLADDLGYRSVELACWPQGKAARRYAGTSHIDVQQLDKDKAESLLAYAAKRNVEIMALGYYPNPMTPDSVDQKVAIDHIKALIKASALLGVNRISTFIGKDKDKSLEENFELFESIWPEIITVAEEYRVYVGIENCPMYFSADEWPGGLNLASSPFIWKKMFEIIPSKYFGLSYDPSHLHLQGMDYLKPLYDFKDRLFHIHLKDIYVDQDKLDEYGIFTHPLNYMDPRIPGRGGIDWKAFMTGLKDIGYEDCACVEVEDREYEENDQSVKKALKESFDFISSL